MKFLWFALFMAIGICGTALCYYSEGEPSIMLFIGIIITMIGYSIGSVIAVVSFMQAIGRDDDD